MIHQPPSIAQDVFVRDYAERSGLIVQRIGKTFFESGRFRFTATRCHCGEIGCEGWMMDAGKPIPTDDA